MGDGLCIINGSVLRGCGLQVMAAKVVLFSYYVVAIPVSVVLGFYTDMGVLGLAWGITLGTFVHCEFTAFILCLLRTVHSNFSNGSLIVHCPLYSRDIRIPGEPHRLAQAVPASSSACWWPQQS